VPIAPLSPSSFFSSPVLLQRVTPDWKVRSLRTGLEYGAAQVAELVQVRACRRERRRRNNGRGGGVEKRGGRVYANIWGRDLAHGRDSVLTIRQQIELQTMALSDIERLLRLFKAGQARFHEHLMSRLAATSTQFVQPSADVPKR